MGRTVGWLEMKLVRTQKIKTRLLNLKDTAAYVGLAPKTVRNRLSEGTFPVKPRYYGGKPLFEVSELDDWIDSLPR